VTVVRRNGVEWVAPKDGIAHATANHAPRTLCDKIATPDRYAWPIGSYCAICLSLERGLKRQQRGAA
jgi:hypothetical protein